MTIASVEFPTWKFFRDTWNELVKLGVAGRHLGNVLTKLAAAMLANYIDRAGTSTKGMRPGLDICLLVLISLVHTLTNVRKISADTLT